jgi:hypothetical protein
MEPRFYEGDATVRADGVVYPCRANLRCWADRVPARSPAGTAESEGPQQWVGRLRFDDGDAQAVLFAGRLCLVVDGAEGVILVDSNDPTTGAVEIRGTGAPPF